MSEHIVLQIIRDLGITNEKNLASAVEDLRPDDAISILDKMESYYSSHFHELKIKRDANPLAITWIPVSSDKTLDKISSNLILANSVILSDPLYDYMVSFEGNFFGEEQKEIEREVYGSSVYRCSKCEEDLRMMIQQRAKAGLVNIFRFYLRSKDLIQEEYIIPYVDITPRDRTSMKELINIFKKYDSKIANLIKYEEKNKEQLFRTISGEQHAVTINSIPFIERSINISFSKWMIAAGVDEVLNNEGPLASSIDFLGGLSDSVMRRTIKLISQSMKSKGIKGELPYSHDMTIVPMLSGVPIEIIPEIVTKEKDAFEQFRYSLVSKFNSISAPYGSREWKAELDLIRINLEHDTLELKRTLLGIKKIYNTKQVGNFALVGLSVGIASLALMNQSFNAITAIQGIAGGAGITTGLKSVFDTWVEYQEKIKEQKLKDTYYLLNLKQSKSDIQDF